MSGECWSTPGHSLLVDVGPSSVEPWPDSTDGGQMLVELGPSWENHGRRRTKFSRPSAESGRYWWNSAPRSVELGKCWLILCQFGRFCSKLFRCRAQLARLRSKSAGFIRISAKFEPHSVRFGRLRPGYARFRQTSPCMRRICTPLVRDGNCACFVAASAALPRRSL